MSSTELGDAGGPGGESEAVVEIHGIAAGGAGVGRLPSGKTIFVQRTAPGDRARVRVERERSRWAQGSLQELVRAGPERREAPCPHYQRCGGCTLEHLGYDAQLQAKAAVVREALRRIGGLEGTVPGPADEGRGWPPVEPSPREFRYRSRVSFTLLRTQRGRVLAGFHELERPGRLVDLGGECLLPEEPLARVWDDLRDKWGPGARRLPPGRRLRLTLQAAGDGAVLTVSRQGRGTSGKRRGSGSPGEDAEALVEEVGGLRAVWGPGPEGGLRLMAGEEGVRETRAAESFLLRGGSFLQANRGAAEALHMHVVRQVGPPRGLRVVDAYCGVGLYGRLLARHGARAVGVERDPEAVRSAREGAPEGFSVLEGSVEERMAEALPADRVVLNPPRQGLHRDVPRLLGERGPERVLYVSCDPATLARDLARMGDAYEVDGVRCFDLFPQTAHVETVVSLRRADGAGGERGP